MIVNKFRFTVNENDTYINLPLEITFDNFGREDLIKQYENDVIEEIINPIEDFETTRYSHKEWLTNNNEPKNSEEPQIELLAFGISFLPNSLLFFVPF